MTPKSSLRNRDHREPDAAAPGGARANARAPAPSIHASAPREPSRSRAFALGAGIAALLAVVPGAALAQTPYPKSLRIVVTYAAGGPIDAVTRPVAGRLNEYTRTSVIVDNRPGANGAIGYEHVAKSPADGYTLVIGSAGPFAIAPAAYPSLPYDPVRDFTPVTNMATFPGLMVVTPSLPAKNVKELIALARSRPGQIAYGSAGTGSTPHLAVELFKQTTKTDMVHVPYKGAGPATMDTIGGQVQLMFADLPVLLPQVKGGKLRALAIGTGTRSPFLPEVPTLAEQGVSDVVYENWYGLFVAAATPREMIARLNTDLVAVLRQPETRALLTNMGAVADPGTPDALARRLREEMDRWGRVVKASGLKLE